jgi:preprotein translocase subunit YajC
MATVTSWAGTVTDIGPMYPFAGTEVWMVVGVFVLWILWHVLQLRAEKREFEEDLARLQRGDEVRRALDREG